LKRKTLKSYIAVAASAAQCFNVLTHLMIDPELLVQGYRLGVFPMAMENGAIEWFSPDPRAILPLEDFHVPHALRGLLRKKIFETKIDTAFSDVIEACAKREDTWINREIIESYIRLHELGYAHSVEAWTNGKLAGGLYGVAIGGAFFGESMFHRVTDASKIALVALVEYLRARKFALLDTQWLTPHLQQFGGIEISRNHYLRLLQRAAELPRKF
jgi:leucyl/phenylalanyl-tRNA--protein transferase